MEELDLTEEDMQERYESGLRAEAQFFEMAIGYIEYPTEESKMCIRDRCCSGSTCLPGGW